MDRNGASTLVRPSLGSTRPSAFFQANAREGRGKLPSPLNTPAKAPLLLTLPLLRFAGQGEDGLTDSGRPTCRADGDLRLKGG